MQRILSALQQYWGYDSFRPLQQEAMASVLAGRDSVTILPTGGGKSLCFQAPALAMEGMAVVVSPLIALMKDQVDALNACGVPAAYINSTITNEQRYATDAGIREGRLKLVYVTPERLAKPAFIDYLRRYKIAFIAVDEAHCISMWGHDFRPEYRQLKELKARFPGIALHAYTATATPPVRQDIVQELNLERPDVHVGNFDRPNLLFRVQRRTDLPTQLLTTVEGHRGESGIIYCIRRKDTEAVAEMLCERGFRALAYHAGLSDEERRRNQEAFIQEEADIIVATVAFGMGIDKSNVRYVIHAGMPKSLEHYQQESGRAGRDGLEADCLLLYSGADFQLWQRLIQESEAQGSEVALGKLRDLYDYCTGITCRHSTIVRYFGQAWERAGCNACDVCLDEIDVMPGAYAVAKTICEAVQGVDQRFGGGYVAKILRGERDERVLHFQHNDLRCYGGLSGYPVQAIRAWIDQLIAQDFLEKAGDYGVLQLTGLGRLLYCGDPEAKPRLLEPARKTRRREKTAAPVESWEGVDRDLFEALRILRRELAHEEGKPPYVIFGDRTLRELARRRPATVEAMMAVHGVGQRKCETYGSVFIDAIRSYCEMNSRDMDVDMAQPPAREASLPRARTAARDHAFQLFRAGESVEAVQQEVQRATSTVWQYLEEYVITDGRMDVSPWVDDATYERVREAVKAVGMGPFKPLFDHLEGEVPYEVIRVAVASLRQSVAQEAQ
jgi:ATP-dependent DNA helicase RecQ